MAMAAGSGCWRSNVRTVNFRSADDYRRTGPRLPEVSREASRPAPSNVMDGRFFGDEAWGELFQPTCAATADQAAKVAAVSFCLSFIAESVGSLAFDFMTDEGPATDFPLADVVSYAPNPMQTGAEFWSSLVYRACLAGVAFAEPVVDGEDVHLWPLHPDRLRVDWRERGFTAWYTDERGGTRMFNPGQLFWIAGLADGRIQPLAPWKMAKGSIDFALALESQGREFFRKGAKLAGVLEMDKTLDADAYNRLSDQVAAWRAGKTPILEDGLKYKSVSSNFSEAQFVELIRQRTLEMARHWHIPRSFVADDAGPVANQENEALGYVKYTIRPLARRIEQAIGQRLMTPDQRRRYKPKINLDALLRGDSATQWKNAVLARTASGMSVNEIRTRWFGLPKLDDPRADDPWAPLNSNRAADTMSGGQTAPQDMTGAENG